MHNIKSAKLLAEELDHGVQLLLALLVVGSDVSQKGDAGVLGSGGTASAVLDGDALAGLVAELLAGVKVDGRVRLGDGGVDAAGSGEDADVGLVEELVHLGLLNGGDDAGHGGGGDDGHVVLLVLLELLEDLNDVLAGFSLCTEVRNGGVELLGDPLVELVGGDGEAVTGAEAGHHAAEVLADELVHELGAAIALLEAELLENLVGELSAGLERGVLGENERVIAVEEKALDLTRERLDGLILR